MSRGINVSVYIRDTQLEARLPGTLVARLWNISLDFGGLLTSVHAITPSSLSVIAVRDVPRFITQKLCRQVVQDACTVNSPQKLKFSMEIEYPRPMSEKLKRTENQKSGVMWRRVLCITPACSDRFMLFNLQSQLI